MSDKKYSNLHPKELAKLEKAFSIGIKKSIPGKKADIKKIRDEALEYQKEKAKAKKEKY